VKKESGTKKLSSRGIPLEETIRKVLHSELKLIFADHFSFSRDSTKDMPKLIVAPMEPKKEP